MNFRSAALFVTFLVLAAGCGADEAGTTDEGSREDASATGSEFARAVMAEVDAVAAGDIWPGFDPAGFPVAIHVADSTFLFRHPSPEGFVEVPEGDMWGFPGRHPAMIANTVVELEGVPTATVLADPSDQSVLSTAAVVVHETFHAFQMGEYPGWGANPTALFTYPMDEVEALSARRLETRALRHALESEDGEESRCWARAALQIRGERFAGLPSESIEYERGVELHEGTAFYVEHRAAGRAPDEAGLPEEGFPPSGVRLRAASAGAAFALLLDGMAPGWQEDLDSLADPSLDALLAEALAGESVATCGFDESEREDATIRADEDVRGLRAERDEAVRAFEESEGWRIAVEAVPPLAPQGFDPMNVQVLGDGRVLHQRMLRLGSDAVTLEIMDRPALTTGAGANPLFDGVRAVLLTGLDREPTITQEGEDTRIEGDGVEIEVRQGEVRRSDRTIRVVLDP